MPSPRTATLRRVAYGDWQTPPELAAAVAEHLAERVAPRAVLEPTCGTGSLLAAAGAAFPKAALFGYEIDARHAAAARRSLKPLGARIFVRDFFHVAWDRVLTRRLEPWLVLGNPPWVTVADLGAVGSGNAPPRDPRLVSGLDALTGASNFDIAEWMITHLARLLGDGRGALAMLCKTSVARRVVARLHRDRVSVAAELRAIDARQAFGASVDACLLTLTGGVAGRRQVLHYASLTSRRPARTMSLRDGELVPDARAYDRSSSLAGVALPVWRSGVKHDCASVLELDAAGRNGVGERVDVEPAFLYPLVKGADLLAGDGTGATAVRRSLILPQAALGDDTSALAESAPKLHRYLTQHQARFAARRSRVYRGRGPFAVFGVGSYSFAPYKVAVAGLGKRLAFAMLGPVGGKPTLFDDTTYFLPFASRRDAELALTALRSDEAREFFQARIFWDEKRPITKRILMMLSLRELLRRTHGEAMATRWHARQVARGSID